MTDVESLTVIERGGSWCYIDSEGKVVKRLTVSEAYPFVEGMAAIRIYSCFGFIDRNFKIVVEPQYGYGTGMFQEGLAVVKSPGGRYSDEDRYGYINKKGQEVIPLIYEMASNFCEGQASVRLNGKWGVINKKGHTVIDFQFNDLSDCHNGNFIFIRDNKFGILNKNKRRELISSSINADDMDNFSDYIYFYGSSVFLKRGTKGEYILIDDEENVLFTWETN